jgi:viroplasmin and RNaseH domain-containing protein
VSLDNKLESVDYYLTRPQEPISNFLALSTHLKICYATSQELKIEKRQMKLKYENEIKDFDFIKTLGKGGFAKVYMGKCLLISPFLTVI